MPRGVAACHVLLSPVRATALGHGQWPRSLATALGRGSWPRRSRRAIFGRVKFVPGGKEREFACAQVMAGGPRAALRSRLVQGNSTRDWSGSEIASRRQYGARRWGILQVIIGDELSFVLDRLGLLECWPTALWTRHRRT